MGTVRIPVDLVNPGQVFACLGFLEAAEALCGAAEGGFFWEHRDDPFGHFEIEAEGADHPIAHVLEFLAGAEVAAVAPEGWVSPKKDKKSKKSDKEGKTIQDDQIERVKDAPASELSEMALPIILGGGNRPAIRLGHWADGSSCDSFKLYSGNRAACDIGRAMLSGKKKGKRQETLGIRQLWDERREDLVADPLHTLCPMGGSFNFDARCAWTPIDAGYSPDEQDQKVFGSPVVELLAAWGLEHARPREIEGRLYRYAIWRDVLPPLLARPALAGTIVNLECRHFRVLLGLAGKNKVVGFAEEILG